MEPPSYSAVESTAPAGLLGTPEDLVLARDIALARGRGRVLAALRVSKTACDDIAWGPWKVFVKYVRYNPLCYIPPYCLIQCLMGPALKKNCKVLESVFRHTLYIVTEDGLIQYVDKDAVRMELGETGAMEVNTAADARSLEFAKLTATFDHTFDGIKAIDIQRARPYLGRTPCNDIYGDTWYEIIKFRPNVLGGLGGAFQGLMAGLAATQQQTEAMLEARELRMPLHESVLGFKWIVDDPAAVMALLRPAVERARMAAATAARPVVAVQPASMMGVFAPNSLGIPVAAAPAATAERRVFLANKNGPRDFSVMYLRSSSPTDWETFCVEVRHRLGLGKSLELELADVGVRVTGPGDIRDSDKVLAWSP
eukprot:m.50645 g.50645  ORF g.50645 m.50645 type:complete len:368 (-) comp6245_c0_seq1:280-1383(-)